MSNLKLEKLFSDEKYSDVQTEILKLLEEVSNQNYAEGVKEGNARRKRTLEFLEKSDEMKEFKEYIIEMCGKFTFLFYDEELVNSVLPQYLFRFLYLCTFSNYDNLLMYKNKPIEENKLQFMWQLSRMESYNTKKALIDAKLITIKDKKIYINKKINNRGSSNVNLNNMATRVFDDYVKEIYENSKPIEHKRLALLVKVLPFLNYNTNVLCSNPFEKDINKLKHLTIPELSKEINYSQKRIKSELLEITVYGEKAIGFFITKGIKSIVINPKVFYKGSDISELKGLINLFEIKK